MMGICVKIAKFSLDEPRGPLYNMYKVVPHILAKLWRF